MKTTQIAEVKRFLEENGTITSWEAIQEFGATRLSDIIFKLRRKYGMNIQAKTCTFKNRYGNPSSYAQYVLKRTEQKSQSL